MASQQAAPEETRDEAARLPDPTEIRTLVGRLDDLDYYEILKVERGAALSRIRSAYHEQSRAFHPDRFLSVDEDLRQSINTIAKRIKEAYAVLRHPVKRTQYNKMLTQDEKPKSLRFTNETAVAARRAREEESGMTPKGRELFRQAQEDRKKGNIPGAVRNIKMALAYESENPRFLAFLDEIVKPKRIPNKP